MIFLRKNSVSDQEPYRRIRTTQGTGVFNVSLLGRGDQIVVSFRASPTNGRKKIGAFFGFYAAGSFDFFDLETVVQDPLIRPISDPKLFEFGSGTWVTYNTGHSERPNRLYVQQLRPELGQPVEVRFAGRSDIEKNWAFFEHDGKWHALYSCNPLVVLRSNSGPVDSEIWFEEVFRRGEPQRSERLTIGSQLARIDGGWRVILHEKLSLFRRRMYLGRAAEFVYNPPFAELKVSRKRMAHSFGSLFGSSRKYNRRLISCTYFSGLVSGENAVDLAYGINDLDFGISRVKWGDLW